ncbi:MAG: CDP-alcohol phosphatidyltransferase family protein [Acidobacteriota bacterium]
MIFHWQLPDGPLRSSVAWSFAPAILGLAGVAIASQAALDLSSLYPLKAAGVFAAGSAVAIGLVGAHHPFDRFGPGNTTTMIRAGLVALMTSLIAEPGVPMVAVSAAALGLVATALDGVDGWLARRTGMTSAFGARFDMETDVFLVLALSVLAWQFGKAGVWVLLCGLMRYGFVAGGWLWPWLRGPLPATRRGKTICVVQFVGLSLTIVPAVEPRWSAPVAAVTLAALVYSFGVDVLRLRRGARGVGASSRRLADSYVGSGFSRTLGGPPEGGPHVR